MGGALVVLEQDNGRFTNYVPVEFTQDRCESVDDLSVGDEIEITYRLNGRKWQKDPSSEVKFFLNAEAISFRSVGSAGASDTADVGSVSKQDANDALNEAAYDEDDVPF